MAGRGSIARLSRAQWLLLLLAPVLLWPAVLNGGPFFFPDTSAYVRGIDTMVYRATGHRTDWTGEQVERVAALGDGPRAGATAAPEPNPVLLGRSPYYGVIAWLGAASGSFWSTLLVQALIAWGACLGLLRHAVDPSRGRVFGLSALAMLAVLAVTPLPFFTSMLMPDFMSGIALFGATALIAGWRGERRWGRLGWLVLTSYAALAHASHVLILLAVATPALVSAVVSRRSDAVRGAAAVMFAAGLGLAGDVAFARAVEAATHRPPIRPPFLTARLVDDGPGSAYLKAHCPEARFVLCDYVARLPARSDTLLWSADPRSGVFSSVAPDIRRRLAAEQGRFVLAVIADRPWAVLRSSARSALKQFASLGLPEFNNGPKEARDIDRQLPAAARGEFARSPSARHAMPVSAPEWATALLLPLALLTIALGMLHRPNRRTAGLGLMVVAGWVANNVVCGVMSTPHERYQARVVWAVIAAATLLALRMIADRRNPRIAPA